MKAGLENMVEGFPGDRPAGRVQAWVVADALRRLAQRLLGRERLRDFDVAGRTVRGALAQALAGDHTEAIRAWQADMGRRGIRGFRSFAPPETVYRAPTGPDPAPEAGLSRRQRAEVLALVGDLLLSAAQMMAPKGSIVAAFETAGLAAKNEARHIRKATTGTATVPSTGAGS